MSKEQSKDLKHLIAKAISICYASSERDIVAAYDKIQSWDQIIMVLSLHRGSGLSTNVLLQMAVEVKGLEKIN